jgi:hypothetical protein
MTTYNVGDKVRNNDSFGTKFNGTVVGHGWSLGAPVVLVSLGNKGGYINNDHCYCYVSVIVVHLDSIEKDHL